MALDKPLRHVKERVLSAFAQQIGTQFHPITITLAGFMVGLASVICALNGGYLYALVLWLINRFLDGLDGTVARETNRQSDFGGYLDLLADFTIYALIPLALALSQHREDVYVALGLLLTSFYVNAASWMVLSSLLERRNTRVKTEYTSIAMPAGLIEGTETIAFYVLFFLFPTQLTLLFIVMAVLVSLTILQRIWWAAKTL
jgi:phosphatidylglycerophosphate synthase